MLCLYNCNGILSFNKTKKGMIDLVKSKAQQAATKRYEAKAYDSIHLLLPKGTKERIRLTGDSVNGFITKAVIDRLKEFEDKDKGPDA